MAQSFSIASVAGELIVGGLLGVVTGAVGYLWDWWNDGDVTFYGDVLWSKALWGLFIPLSFMFMWTMGWVPGATVVGAVAGWAASAVTAWLLDFVWGPIATLLSIPWKAAEEIGNP